ncbi:MAG TPA: hypothetical protein VMG74_04535 [Gaiellaceae bacterium]|nr:hypothetical protein [Gaiellaceae bacterium]
MIYWRVAPDGRRLTIRWLERHGHWEVKCDQEAGWVEARRLRRAMAAAVGEPATATWIRAIEAEIEAGNAEPYLREAQG